MRAVYIVDNAKIAKVLVDPMRRAILDLLRQKPMTQAGLAKELGLSGASLNFHMKILRSNRLVTIVKKEIERHRILQIFFSTVAYFFVYDLDSLPKNIARYFYPVSLERARSIISLLVLKKDPYSDHLKQTPEEINAISERLSFFLVRTAMSYEKRIVNHADEQIIYEIYTKALSNLLKND
jgi:DNA-binding transcriptional ArsR family regulator